MDYWTELREWLTAIGTVGAVIVALWFGVTGNIQAQREDKRRARLYAAGMVTRLAHARDIFSNCGAICVFGAHPVNPDPLQLPQNLGRAIGRVQNLLRKPRFEPSTEALVGMVALDNNCASRIASAFDQIKRIESEVMAYNVLEATLAPRTGARLADLLEGWGTGFMRSVNLLNAAIAECAQAAEIAAPEPSGEEMNGGPDHDDEL